MRIKKFWSNYAFTFVLIAAFLATQWTTTHAHLNDHHKNEGLHHQHQIKAHTHNLAVYQSEVINFSHPATHEHANQENIIEFDFDVTFSKREKQKNPSSIVADLNFQLLQPSLLPRIKIPVYKIVRPRRLCHSKHNPRAPPKTS